MATIGPKKDGGPNIDFFQSPDSLAQFDQIRVWLQKNCKKVSRVETATNKDNVLIITLELSLSFTTRKRRLYFHPLYTHHINYFAIFTFHVQIILLI